MTHSIHYNLFYAINTGHLFVLIVIYTYDTFKILTLSSFRAEIYKSMNRRGTVTLHDMILMDPTAKSHYLRLHELKADKKDSKMPVESSISPMQSKWTDEDSGNTIEYDPLLLAESMVLLEEDDDFGEEKKDEMNPIPLAPPVSTITRRVSVCGKTIKAIKIPKHCTRKNSALDEHERVVDALKSIGLLGM